MLTFADKGYQGARGTVWTPFKRRRTRLSRRQKSVNRHHAKIRALSERAVSTLKTWKILTKLRCSPRRATPIVQAILYRAETRRMPLTSGFAGRPIALTASATSPLVNRALGNYAQGIVKLRDGSWLLAEAGGTLAEYARAFGIDLPPQPVRDQRNEAGPGHPRTQWLPQSDEPTSPDTQSRDPR